MKYGFVKVAAATPHIRVADCAYNTEQIESLIKDAEASMVKVLVFPELCITGYTCGDLFLQDCLLDAAEQGLRRLLRFTASMEILVAVGLPIKKNGKLYNAAAVIYDGNLLGFVPKANVPNHSEFYEGRHFCTGNAFVEWIDFDGMKVPFGTNLLYQSKECRELVVAIEICEDLWAPLSPGNRHALAGATVLLNLSASDELTGKNVFRRSLVKEQSSRLLCGYVYADAGEGESTTDLVFAGHNLIAEVGTLLKESIIFENSMIITEIDLGRIASERRRINSFYSTSDSYHTVEYSTAKKQTELAVPVLTRTILKSPFVPENVDDRERRCEEIIKIQAMGLKKRMKHTGTSRAVVGVSGGLDSTLAILIAKEVFDLLNLDTKGIIAVTMPCFGTTDRTYKNAVLLAKELGATIMEIPIRDSVTLHLNEIGHDLTKHDVTYENAQARERTQVLMDLANRFHALVIGTGDMSELALGWATYNGDHMSMYGVNASVPKTLVRHLVAYFAEKQSGSALQTILKDVLDTPVSPELLPPEEGNISQKTEDIVGPYELHDFFLYYVVRYGFTPEKIYFLACSAFFGSYDKAVILSWLKIFYRRFFSQQFKRSCLPDGPKVGSVSLSPRGDLRMPSDASAAEWIRELDLL